MWKYYIKFGCGCSVPKSVLLTKKVTIDGKQRVIAICRKHGKVGVGKFSYCIDCGVLIEVEYSKNYPAMRCNLHADIAKHYTAVENNEFRRKNKIEAIRYEKKLKTIGKKVRQKYCRLGVHCEAKTHQECWECKEYIGIFKHDPKKLIEMVG